MGSRRRFRRERREHVPHRRAHDASRLQAAVAVQRRGPVQAVGRRRVLVVRHAGLPQLGPAAHPRRADGHGPGNRTVPRSVRRRRSSLVHSPPSLPYSSIVRVILPYRARSSLPDFPTPTSRSVAILAHLVSRPDDLTPRPSTVSRVRSKRRRPTLRSRFPSMLPLIRRTNKYRASF